MVRVCHDEALRPGVVDVPFVEGSPTLKLLDPEALDPWTGVPTRDGLAAELNAITG
tara:strand:- start:158 stop:325 length:168 start_codon:yes stop_codon:yes gene_type:complete